MDHIQLAYFLSVAQHHNFSAAAREHFVSQPCISHQIKSLEDELGVELFIRNTRTVELTDAGELFLDDAKQILDIAEKAQHKLLTLKQEARYLNIIHLAAPTQSFLPAIINQFQKEYPHIKLKLDRKTALQVNDSAYAHEGDIYCAISADLRQVDYLATKKILTDPFCLVTPKDHPAIQRMNIDYSKLASEPFLQFNPKHALYMNQQIAAIYHQLGFTPRISETYNVYEELLYAIASGMGIAILPYHTKDYLKDDLSYTLIDTVDITMDLALGWDQDIKNPAVPLFLDVFREYMDEHPQRFL